MAYETLLVETDGNVGIITLNRPDALNALNAKLCGELVDALAAYEADANIGCVVLTGAGRAFAAGADIKEMAPQSYMDVYQKDLFGAFEHDALAQGGLVGGVNRLLGHHGDGAGLAGNLLCGRLRLVQQLVGGQDAGN